MNKNLTPVESSQIKAIGHEGTTLTVEFKNGSVYEYANVPPTLHQHLMGAESVGKFFSQYIKGNEAAYPFTKVN